MPPREREARRGTDTDTPPPLPPRRNPQRDWAAPPPWAAPGAPGDPDDVPPPAFLAGRDADPGDEGWGAASRGLAGSAADRLAGPGPDDAPPARAARPAQPDDDLDDWQGAAAEAPERARRPERSEQLERFAPSPWEQDDTDAPPDRDDRYAPPGRRDRPARPPERRAGRPASGGGREHVRRAADEDPEELFGPAWERPRRYEAYPSLRTRIGLPSLPGISGLAMAVVALVLAAVVLFFVGPMLLGIGGKGPDIGGGATPSPSVAATPEPSPTATPPPTPFVYVVVKGDTMSKIASRFGVTIDDILAVNPKIKDPDKIAIGDEITIPQPGPTALPNEVGGSAAP
jgi:nucleoid-associated protein YgaU